MSKPSMPLFDTHAHLAEEELIGDQEGVVERARRAGVEQVLCVAVTAESSRRCVELAARHDGVWASVGIQPNYCGEAAPEHWDAVVGLLAEPKVVALGETGLDRYWDHSPWDAQQDYFDRHLRLSQERDVPFIVHMRDCGEEIHEMLLEARRRGPLRGVMHSFTGDADLACRCLELGLHISFAGMVTYKKSEELRAVAATIPDDRILIETDSPYLSPHPQRGHRPNEPALLVHTARCLAEVRGVEPDDFARQTTENARRLFLRP